MAQDILANIPYPQLKGALSGLGVLGVWLIWIFLIGLLVFIFIKFSQYKYKALIFDKRGNKIWKIRMTRVRRIERKGVIKYQFMEGPKFIFDRGKTVMPPKDYNSIYTTGKRDFLMFAKMFENIYLPIEFKNPEPTFEVVPQSVLYWQLLDNKAAYDAYHKPSMFEKYAPFIFSMAFLIIMFVLFLILLNKMEVVAQSFGNYANAVQQTLSVKPAAPPA